MAESRGVKMDLRPETEDRSLVEIIDRIVDYQDLQNYRPEYGAG